MLRHPSFSSVISDVSESSAGALQHASSRALPLPKKSVSLPAVAPTVSVAKASIALLLSQTTDEDPILKALEVPCGQRTASDLRPIADFIKGLRFFQVFSRYPETVNLVAQRLELQTFINGTHVFFEGHPGNEFYIVLDGEISIIKKKRISAYMDFITENVMLVKLSCGQTFGETALDSEDGLRTASAVATKRSSLLVLRREDYHDILFYFKTWLKQAVSAALRSGTSIFRQLRDEVIESIAARTVVRSFSINAEIFAENARISSVMIVKSGVVRLMKGLPVETVEASIAESKAKFNRQGQAVAVAARPRTSPTKVPGPRPSAGTSRGTALSDSMRARVGTAMPRDTPPGHWLLRDSQEYLDSSKPLRIVTKNAQGGDTVTEVHREITQQPPQAERKQLFTVAALMSGEVLGEISLLGADQLSAVSAYAATAVELYCIDNDVLFQFEVHKDPAVMGALLDDWKFRNPPPEEVKKALQAKYEWQVSKRYVLKGLKASRGR